MKVRYKGNKVSGMPIYEPVGVTPRKGSKIKCVAKVGECVELTDDEAESLCKLDPNNFEIVDSSSVVVEKVKADVVLDESDESEEGGLEPKKKRRGRPPMKKD